MPGINTSMGTSASMKSLLKTEREMLTAMERISSGKRINSAGDDAAGAAISDRMTATIRALDMSIIIFCGWSWTSNPWIKYILLTKNNWPVTS